MQNGEPSKVVTVEFWELRGDTYKQMSTSSKMSRGMMAHACLTNQVKHVRDLPREINGFICVTDIESITIPSESDDDRYEGSEICKCKISHKRPRRR